MGIENKLVFSQTLIFFISFVLSFMLFVPIASNVHEFGGNCLLSATGIWTNVSFQRYELTQVSWGATSACGFGVFIGVVVMLASAVYLVWYTSHLVRGSESSWAEAFGTCLFSIVVCLLLLVSALTVSVGFKQWCDLIISSPVISSCLIADFDTVMADKSIHTKNVYSDWKLAEFAAWTLWICWLVLSLTALYKMFQYHQRERFYVSLNRERQRLLQSVRHQPRMI